MRCWLPGVDLGGRAAAMNSHTVAAELAPKWAKQGVLFGGLSKLVREHGDLLRPFFERRVVDPYKDKFSALNAAWLVGRHAAVRAEERASR